MNPEPIENVRNAAPRRTHKRVGESPSLPETEGPDKSGSDLQRAASGRHTTSGDGCLHRSLRRLPPRRNQQTGPAHFDALFDFIVQIDVFPWRHRCQQRAQSGAGAAGVTPPPTPPVAAPARSAA